MKVRHKKRNLFSQASLTLAGVLILVSLVISAGAQTTASCQFTTFNTRFFVNNGSEEVDLYPHGVNDYGTVVGNADNTVTFAVQAFTRFSGGGISYYRHGSSDTVFNDRDNSGVDLGVYGPVAPYNIGTAFMLKGSTLTPLAITVGGKTYSKLTAQGTNRWGTVVGAFLDSSGKIHAFKRFSNGSAMQLDYPGAAETIAYSINDSGTIVGFYSKTLPSEWRHGFIYNNGQWSTLDYPDNTLQTILYGISNANLITATTVDKSNDALNSYIYVNGTFKQIVLPNSRINTYAYGVSLTQGLITGFSGYTGYIATCH